MMILIIAAMVCLTTLLCTALVTGNWSKVRLAQIQMIKESAEAAQKVQQQQMAGLGLRN